MVAVIRDGGCGGIPDPGNYGFRMDGCVDCGTCARAHQHDHQADFDDSDAPDQPDHARNFRNHFECDIVLGCCVFRFGIRSHFFPCSAPRVIVGFRGTLARTLVGRLIDTTPQLRGFMLVSFHYDKTRNP